MKKNFIFRMLFMMVSFATLSLAMTSCSDDDTDAGLPTLEVSQNSFSFDNQEQEVTVSITSNRDWTATSSDEWLTVTPSEGSGNGYITLSMSATDVTRYGTASVSTYNSYGVLSTANISVTQMGESGVASNIVFDGSELPTSYGTSTVTINTINFAVSNVANYSGSYETTGPIQFKKGGAYIYNTTAIEDLSSVVITLSNSYNNFTVFSGSTENPVTTSITGSTNGSVVTYTIPAGDKYVAIYNNTDATDGNTAYADYIEFVIGDNDSTTGGSTGGDTDDDEELGDGSDQGVISTADFRTKALVGNTCTLENVRVDFKNGNYVYVSADGVSVNVYSSESDLVVGNVVTITGEVGEYYSLKQLTSLTSVEVTSTSDVAPTAAVYTVAELVALTEATVDAITAQYVKLSGVSMTSSTISQGGSSISWYTSLGASYSDDYETYTIYAYVSSYNGNFQLLPTEIIGDGDEVVDPNEGLGTTLTMEDFYYILTDAGQSTTSPSLGDLVTLAESYTIADNFKFDFSESTGSTLPRLYYYGSASTWQIRTYGSTSNTSVMTISTVDGSAITSIIFTTSAGPYFTVNTGELSGDTWSGSASSVSFTGSGGTSQITAIQIITDGDTSTNPDDEDKEEDITPVPVTYTIAELYAQTPASGTLVKVENLTVDYSCWDKGSSLYASDSEGNSIYVYNSGLGLSVGDVVTLNASVAYYNGAMQLSSATLDGDVVSGTSTITPASYTATELAAVIGDINAQFVTVSGVVVDTANTNLTDSEGGVVDYYNTYNAEIEEGYATYTVTGYVVTSTSYGNQIYTTSFVGEGEQTLEPENPNATEITGDSFGITASSDNVYLGTCTVGDYTITYDQGTHSSLGVRYWTDYTMRAYSGNTLTISSTTAIESIEFDMAKNGSLLTVDNGSYDTSSYVWTPEAGSDAKSVVFTFTGSV
ncbi:MAG: hypothetical protein SNG27_02395 [Rikenellaceae bacterium]